MLMGSLSSKAICNYIYSIRAWHTLYGLPWVLHEEQIATMLKGAAKLAPPAIKQDQCKPITVTVEEPPIPFSPFSSADCTMLSHLSFNDFIAIAFPDLAGDLDVQI